MYDSQSLTSESTGSVCISFFFSASAVPSKVQVTLGMGRPEMVAGILMVVPALQFNRSEALTSRVTVGSTAEQTARFNPTGSDVYSREDVQCKHSRVKISSTVRSLLFQLNA